MRYEIIKNTSFYGFSVFIFSFKIEIFGRVIATLPSFTDQPFAERKCESVVCQAVDNHIDEHNLISERHWGFRKIGQLS